MPIEPVKIPQNVYIEDRIVGPLTLRQIIMIAVGGGFSYALYASIAKSYGPPNLIVTTLVWLPAILSAIFALVKVNDLTLARICFLLLERVNKPAQRVYTPRRGLAIHIRTAALANQQRAAEADPETARTQKKIEELSGVLDRGIAVTEADREPAPAVIDHDVPSAEQVTVLDEADRSAPLPLPVDPSRVKTDKPLGSPQLSDLSVFRDIFPHTS